MGTSGGRQAPMPRPGGTGWHPDRSGVRSGRDCGEDIQSGGSYSVRFIRDDTPGSLVTITFDDAGYPRRPGGYVVQRQTEWMVCRDPGGPSGTEIWSDLACTDVSIVHDALELAGREASVFAAECSRGACESVKWDGQPGRRAGR